jgi:amidase
MLRVMDILDGDATSQAEAVRSGTLSAPELIQAAIERSEARNPALNAVIRTRFDEALSEAAHVDPSAPFAGVPMVLKDLTLGIKGEPLYMGTRGLKAADYRSPADSYTYLSLRKAGFVAIGRTNTPEFGTTITTEPLSYGPSRNPWNTNHSTGGSSGGSAAAVAAGIVAVGHANDGGGSIRIPASECGLVGLKPTRGRVSHGPLMAEGWMGSTTCGALTRSVRDAAAVLWAMQGPRPGDPYGIATPLRPYMQDIGAKTGSLRIGIFTGPQAGQTVAQDCVDAVGKAAGLLTILGHRLTEDVPDALLDETFGDKFVTMMVGHVARDILDLEAATGRTFRGRRFRARKPLLRHAWPRPQCDRLSGSGHVAAELPASNEYVVGANRRRWRRFRPVVDPDHRHDSPNYRVDWRPERSARNARSRGDAVHRTIQRHGSARDLVAATHQL